MTREKTTVAVAVTHQHGLHARPCLAIVNTVRKYQAEVTVAKDGQTANAASILELMTLGAAQGQALILSASGPEAEDALNGLSRLFASGFAVW